MTRRHATILALTLPAVALATLASGPATTDHPASPSAKPPARPPRAHTSFTVRASRTTPANLTPQPATAAPERFTDAHSAAAGFTSAYARYLEGLIKASGLPDLSPAASATVSQAGPLPPRLRTGRLLLTGLQATRTTAQWSANFTLTAHGGRITLTALLTLTPTSTGWLVSAVTPPDLDVAIAPNPVPPSPAEPAGARSAALAFTNSWLAFTYGHSSPAQLTDLTASLRSALTASPPRMPAAIRALRPRVASLALQPDGKRWLANANVTDGHNTYQVTMLVGQVHGVWRILSLRSTG